MKANGTPYTYYHPECKKCTIKKAAESNYDKELRKKQSREWKQRQENKEKVNEYRRKYRADGKQTEWLRNNKDKVRKYQLSREMHKKHDITKQEWELCKEYFDNSCAYCGLHEVEHYRRYLDDVIKQDLHKEHVDHNGSNDLSNCIPACQTCNSSKHTSTLEEWYNESNPYFTKERLVKIHRWLESDYKIYIK